MYIRRKGWKNEQKWAVQEQQWLWFRWISEAEELEDDKKSRPCNYLQAMNFYFKNCKYCYHLLRKVYILGWVFLCACLLATENTTVHSTCGEGHSFLWTFLWLKVFRPLYLCSNVLFAVLETLRLDYVVQTFDSFRTLVWLVATSCELWFRSCLWFLESFIFFSCFNMQWHMCVWNLILYREYRTISKVSSFERILCNAEGMRLKQGLLWILPERK
jgi:hypothetical protein